jgi:integrase
VSGRGGRRDFGWVRKLPSGRFQASYLGPDGRRRNAPQTYERKQDATRWLSLVESEIGRGEWRDPAAGEERLVDYAERWVRERVGLRPRTIEQYRYQLRRYIRPHLGQLRLVDLDDRPAVIRSWRSRLLESGVSASGAAKDYRLLRANHITAVDDATIRRNPCRIRGAGTETPDERPTLTARQVGELARRVPPRYSALILLTTYASLRFGEVTALRRSDLDLAVGLVRVERAYVELSSGALIFGPPKSRAGDRAVGLPPALLPLLAEHLAQHVQPAEDALLFTGSKGGPLRRSTFNRVVNWTEATAGVGAPGLHFHDLRHTGNHLAAQVPGTTVRDLMARMGHDNERAAMIYLHRTQGADRRIADALPVDLGDPQGE